MFVVTGGASCTGALHLKLTGYTCFYTNRQIKKGGGVAIFVKSLFNAKKVDKCSISINDMYECLTVELIFENCKNTYLTCVYRTPGSSIELFIENFSLILNNMNMNKNVYICGDFNIDLLKFEVNNETKVFIDTMYSMGLFPLITRPSRLTEFMSTLIDNIFSNIVNFRHYSGLFVTDITDHLPVFVVSNINGVKTLNLKKKYKGIRKISSESLDKFKEDLSKESWASVYSANSVDLAYDTFINIFIGLYDKHCRTKRICINGNSDNKPWFTKGLKNACIKKNLLYRKFLKTRLNIDNNKYKTYKNKLTTVLRACEKNYYNIQLKINKSNIKNTWKLINNVLNKSKFSEDCEHFKINNNEYTSDCKVISDKFNQFFVNVGPTLASKIKIPELSVNRYVKHNNVSSMFISAVLEDELINVVKNLSNKTSMDHNHISMSLVKNVISDISKPLTYIANKSFSQGCFPEQMKIAKVLPLYKNGDRELFTNYRPVSLLSQFSKIIEKLFANRLDSFINKHGLINNCQYGFRSNRSTSLALIEYIEEISNSIDNKNVTIGVSIDLKKAFDTIDHGILIKKLDCCGIRGIAKTWLQSYLQNRFQYVEFGNSKSELLKITCGVPQGSVLGPKLFLLYIDDICNVSQLLKLVLFADDTNIYYSHKDVKQLVNTLNTELVKLQDWFAVNKLSLNILKTNFMIFGNIKTSQDINIRINNELVNRAYSNKFLGVIVDDKLCWREHIHYVKTKLSKNIAILYKVKYKLSCEVLRSLYCTLILPYLTYCVEIWGNTYKSNLISIEKLQKRAIRIISGVSFLEHTSPLFKNFKLLKFFDLVHFQTYLIMYKAFHFELPINLQNMFIIDKSIYYDTRSKFNFKLRYVRTKLKSMCVSVLGVKLWNALDDKVKSIQKFFLFKKTVKNDYFIKY